MYLKKYARLVLCIALGCRGGMPQGRQMDYAGAGREKCRYLERV